MIHELSRPIPGQSLTSTPREAPWERPPEIVDPVKAAMWHLNRLVEEDRAEAALDALELGLTIVDLTKGILRNAVSEGVHSLDVSLIVAPLIHEHLLGLAKASSIDFDEGLPTKGDRKEIDYAIKSRKSRKLMDEVRAEMGSRPELDYSEEQSPNAMVELEEEVEQPRGLMSPRGVM